MIVVWILLIAAIAYLVIFSLVDIVLMGFARLTFQFKLVHKKFMIQRSNRVDFQENFECSGYSSAYLLRHYGIEANGVEIYNKMPEKMAGGYVYPKAIPHVLSTYGIHVKYRIGNLTALKNTVTKGNPVIVMIRYRTDKKWLHFVPVVGYDEEYIYLAESLKEYDNCHENEYCNRKIEIKEFKRLWNTSMFKMPLYRNTFFGF